MNNKICLMLVWFIGVYAVACGAEAHERHKLRIYLPKDKVLESEVVELGKIAVVLGDDAIASLANEMKLGQFSVQGQELIIDRKTILSCLAGSGIKASSVVFNGAEAIHVRRDEDTVEACRFVDTAREYLRGQLSEEQFETLKLIRPVKDYPLGDESETVTLTALMSRRQSDRMKYVTVRVMRNGVELDRRELAFSVQHSCQRLIAKHTLKPGTLITAENTVIEKYISNTPEPVPASSIYGMEAKHDIAGGTTITKAMAGYREAPILIKKRQKVLLKLDAGGLLVSAPGEATEDGRLGDIIRVQRGSRQTRDLKIVLGEVMTDGTVRPLL